MNMQDRMKRLERRQAWTVFGVAVAGLFVGAMLGAGMDDSSPTIAHGLVVVGDHGKPVIDLGTGPDGAGQVLIRSSAGSPLAAITQRTGGGVLDLFNADGKRLARLGPSPTGDGALVLSAADGSTLLRAGRHDSARGVEVWTAPDGVGATDSSTP